MITKIIKTTFTSSSHPISIFFSSCRFYHHIVNLSQTHHLSSNHSSNQFNHNNQKDANYNNDHDKTNKTKKSSSHFSSTPVPILFFDAKFYDQQYFNLSLQELIEPKENINHDSKP